MRISLKEAIEIIESNVKKIEDTEIVCIKNLKNGVSAKDIYSKINVPPFNRSPLDGYALISSDTNKGDVALEVVDEIFAGDKTNKSLEVGKAIRIMTGAPIPKGADCVIREELTTFKDNKIFFNYKLNKNDNICFEGEDIKKGSLLLKKGEVVGYIEKAILSSVGFNEVEIYKKPKVMLLISGDEIINSGTLLEGKIYDSNSHILLGIMEKLGVLDIEVKYVFDNVDTIKNIIIENIDLFDFIISTGGVSVGRKDFLPQVIEEIGASKKFHGLNLKPGSPAMFSIYKNKPILSLSGNPFAALVTFELLGRPILSKLLNNKNINFKYDKSILGNNWYKKSNVERYIRAKEVDGKVYLPENHSSGSLFSMKDCNCLIVIEANNKGMSIGDVVTIIRI